MSELHCIIPLLVLAVIRSVVSNCLPPNGTENALHWYSCNTAEHWFITHNVTVVDLNGQVNYPVQLSKGVVLLADATNVGGIADKIVTNAGLWYWGTNMLGMGTCSWRPIPTFGQTSQMDGCSLSGNCPVHPGSADIEQHIDFGRWTNIVETLTSGTAYMIQTQSYNGLPSNEPLACMVVQGMMAMKTS